MDDKLKKELEEAAIKRIMGGQAIVVDKEEQ
jgi:hypothetical protein